MSILRIACIAIAVVVVGLIFNDDDKKIKEKDILDKQAKYIEDQQKLIDALLKEKGIKNDTNR